MSRLRQRSPWFWFLLGGLTVFGGMWVSDLFVEWMPKWLRLVAILFVFLANVYTFRMLWRATDHPAFHPDRAQTPPRSGVDDGEPLAGEKEQRP
jgi:hypothetical protein